MPTTPAQQAPRRRPPRGARRTELLDAALRVIARDGPASTSHRAVAAEAGVPLGSTTYYFASREEMLSQALAHAATQEITQVRHDLAVLAARPDGAVDWTAELNAWVLAQLGPARLPLLVARFHLQLEALHRPELRAIYADWTGAALEFAQTVLAAAGSPDPAADAPVLLAAIDGLALNQLVLLDARSRTRIVTRLVTRLMEHLTRA